MLACLRAEAARSLRKRCKAIVSLLSSSGRNFSATKRTEFLSLHLIDDSHAADAKSSDASPGMAGCYPAITSGLNLAKDVASFRPSDSYASPLRFVACSMR